MTTKRRVGRFTVTIQTGKRFDHIGIGDRWTAQLDGKITVLATSPDDLLVGTTRGVVSRLETVTGRQCARATLDAPIDAIRASGKLVTVTTAGGATVLLVKSLKAPKRR